MILELGIVGLVGTAVKINFFPTDKEKKEIITQWNELMRHTGITNKDIDNIGKEKETETFKINKYIKKEYGCDLLINIPYGISFQKFQELKPIIETSFCCDADIEWYKNQKSACVKLFKCFPTDEFKVMNKWQKIMDGIGLKNKSNVTCKISKVEKQEKYGYDAVISIPEGLSFENLTEKQDIINKNLGLVYLENLNFSNKVNAKIIVNPLSDNYAYKPYKTEPYELYCGLTHYYKSMVVDMLQTPHVLDVGATVTGKSSWLEMVIGNQMYFHTDKELEFYFIQTSNKCGDFDDFLHCKQTKGYAYSYPYAMMMMDYLCKEIAYRSNLFSSHGLKNISQYNKKFPNNKLPYRYLVIDEFGTIAPKEKTQMHYRERIKILDMFEQLTSEGRSIGQYCIMGLQRPDKEHFPPYAKNNCSVKIAFRLGNTASSLTAIDTTEAVDIPNREAILKFAGYSYRIKTPNLGEEFSILKKYIKPSIEKNHKFIDFEAEYNKKEVKTEQNKQKTTEKQTNISSNTTNKIIESNINKKPKQKQGQVKKDVKL